MDVRATASVLVPTQYGTGTHYPDCRIGSCTGCLPPLPPLVEHPQPTLDLSLFRRDT